MLQTGQIKRIIKGVSPDSRIVSIQEFKKGMMNRTYDITISNGQDMVLRVYPRDDWKAEKEEYLYNLLAKRTNVPVPIIYKIDASKKEFPYAYSVLSRVPGEELGKVYVRTRNENLIRDAAKYLAKIHSIKFKKFGWIVGKEIKPEFDDWKGFFDYGLKDKLKKIRKIPGISKNLVRQIRNYILLNQNLLEIKSRPCLVHKDYHFSHIIADKNKINGIIDFEWAVAGHNELDLIKSEWWMFEKLPEIRPIFHDAYRRAGGVISKKFEERKKLYELQILVGMLSLSYKRGSKRWFNYNLKKTKQILGL